ncbi:MAG: carbohydrate-binding protein [Candidatus Hydrogenedentes bacterium]|nr:carbohydrate-binding protein [Candidatus Hydrogenedentota bacterium]
MTMRDYSIVIGLSGFFLLALTMVVFAAKEPTCQEYHVAVNGADTNNGSAAEPYRSIGRAAAAAQPGDRIVIHEGCYREWVNPPRGGRSDNERIVYEAAAGALVEIKGSEVVSGWEALGSDTWRVVLPASFFGDFNPFAETIHGDWFDPKGRLHHRGAVYLNGEWLIEAAALEEVLNPLPGGPPWLRQRSQEYLLNVLWFAFQGDADKEDAIDGGTRIAATAYSSKEGTQNAPASEDGTCVGFILNGHWLLYEAVDFASDTRQVEIRTAAAGAGGIIELRLDGPQGELLGTCSVGCTGGWQAWENVTVQIKPTRGIKNLCFVFKTAVPEDDLSHCGLWFAQAEEDHTTIWAQFKGVDPNQACIEVNVRPAVFYPKQPGINYITVRGLTMCHAATQWAPPTAEQIALIGTHWSRGWIIEDNRVSHSICSGISLGKYGDAFDNSSEDTAEGYVETIHRALKRGWKKNKIGHHVVKNNHISHCEQTGIVGSMGAAFSTIVDNDIHDIHVRELFTGAEMAGIKLHGAIDVLIENNHIYRCCRGLWLDWMAQGARVSSNLFHDNTQDLFMEVNHGPYVIDNNFFLSPYALLDMSRGGAFVHNLVLGDIRVGHYDPRLTPYHKPHSTRLAGMHDNPGGDQRYYNNIFVKAAKLSIYDTVKLPTYFGGNVFLEGACPSKQESDALLLNEVSLPFTLQETEEGSYVDYAPMISVLDEIKYPIVTSALLGRAAIPGLPFENRDGTPLAITRDYFDAHRQESDTFPGPIEMISGMPETIQLWPLE